MIKVCSLNPDEDIANIIVEHGVFFVKYCSILLQALTVEADEDFLFSVYDLTKLKGASWDVAQEE